MDRRRFLLSLLGTVAAAPLLEQPLFAAGKRAARRNREGRVEIQFWHAMSGRLTGTMNKLCDMFNESQTKYQVAAVYQGNYNALSQKLIASIYAGRNPATSQMYESWTTRFLTFGYLRPVQDFLDREPEYAARLKADVFPAFWEGNMFPDPATRKPILATLPQNKSVYMFIVNHNLMRESGFEGPPRDWDELRDLTRKMTRRSQGGAVTVNGFGTRDNIEAFTTMLFAAGGAYMSDAGEILFADKRGEVSMQYLYDIVLGESKSGYIESGFLSAPFGQAKTASFIGSTAGYSFVDAAVGPRFTWRAYPVPPLERGKRPFTLSQGTNVGIFSNVSDEEQEGAWEFIKFLNEDTPLFTWCRETAYMPSRRSLKQMPEFAKYLESDVNYANAVATLEDIQLESKEIYWDNVRLVMDRSVQAMFARTKSPKQALDDAKRQVEYIIASYGAGKQGRS